MNSQEKDVGGLIHPIFGGQSGGGAALVGEGGHTDVIRQTKTNKNSCDLGVYGRWGSTDRESMEWCEGSTKNAKVVKRKGEKPQISRKGKNGKKKSAWPKRKAKRN